MLIMLFCNLYYYSIKLIGLILNEIINVLSIVYFFTIFCITFYLSIEILELKKEEIDTIIVIMTLIGLILNNLNANKIMHNLIKLFSYLISIYLFGIAFFILIGLLTTPLDFINTNIITFTNINLTENFNNSLTKLISENKYVFAIIAFIFMWLSQIILKRKSFATYWLFILLIYIHSTLVHYKVIKSIPSYFLEKIF